MSVFGSFQSVGGDNVRFVASGIGVAVDAGSVSSEWTTDSEDDVKLASNFDQPAVPTEPTLLQKVRKKRVKKWRVKHSLVKHRHLGAHSSSSSSPSGDSSSEDTSTTTSDSESEQEQNVSKSEKRQVRNDRRYRSDPDVVTLRRHNAASIQQIPLQWVPGKKTHRHLAFASSFLNAEDIQCIHAAAKHPSVKEIHDRKGYLAFKHRVVRFEMQLRSLHPALYARLLALMRMADTAGWQKLRKKKNKVYPEIEYIEYDVKELQGECYIEPHVDNKSGVTLVAMLSPSCDYIGGNSCFRRGTGKEGHRQARLEQGDVVMFRGEKLLHWVTNITSGRRVVLQIELSRV